MPEALWVLSLLLLLGALGAVRLVPWSDLLAFGYELMLDSATLGIPIEGVYFLALWLALRYSGRLPQGWYWKSFEHHHLLTPRQKLLVLPWFFTGALAFLGIVLGIAITMLGMVAAAVQSR
jgi:hypothetical protein